MEKENDKKRFAWVPTLLINVGLTTVLLLGLEGGGQVLYRLGHSQWRFEGPPPIIHQAVFAPHPFLVGQLKPGLRVEQRQRSTTITGDSLAPQVFSGRYWASQSTITTTPQGTRWTGADLGDSTAVRVALLGGSTTFGTEVSDEDSWAALLQERLGPGYAVINYGVPGYSTVENIIQMSLIVPEAQPEVVVFFEGWNDIRNYHAPNPTPEFQFHGESQFSNLAIDRGDPRPLGTRLMERSGIGYIARAIRIRLDDLMGKAPPVWDPPTYTTPDPYVDRLYARNLRTLNHLAQLHAITPIFAPQVLNDVLFEGLESSTGWTPHIVGSALPGLLDRFNTIMEQTCAAEGCVFLDDVLNTPWDRTHFADAGHFSRAGGQVFAEIVARQIQRLAPTASAQDTSN